MMSDIETLFTNYQHTIEAIGAVSTFAAVVASLFLARSSSKSKIEAYTSIMIFTQGDGVKRDNPHFLTVSITNTGLTPVRIPFAFFCWKFPFKSGSFLITPLDYVGANLINRKVYPFKIEAKHSELFFLSDLETLRSEMSKVAQDICPFQLLFIRAKVGTEDGTVISAKISKDLRKEFKKIAKLPNKNNK